MKLTPPKVVTFWVSIGLAAVGAILYFLHEVNALSAKMFTMLASRWFSPIGVALIVVGFVLLVLGVLPGDK
jgi:hypothetical protein